MRVFQGWVITQKLIIRTINAGSNAHWQNSVGPINVLRALKTTTSM